MTRRKAIFVTTIMMLTLGFWYVFRAEQEETGMRIDLTIYLGGTIATDGGVILVLPTAVPADEFIVPDDSPNPAREIVDASDPEKIILGADVFAQKSIVRFDYPEGVPYTYRFRTRDPSIDWERIQTGRIGVGSGSGRHPVTGELESYASIYTHHFDVGSWTMGQSRKVRATTAVGFFDERYQCERFAAVQVCDASYDRLAR